MTAETETGLRRSALVGARAWQAVELPADLRRGVEAAAKAAGIEPEAWLTRTVLAAAKVGAARTGEHPLLEKPNAEVTRSLATLLSAARARARERQAEASALTLAEPAPPHETQQEPAPQPSPASGRAQPPWWEAAPP